MSTLWTPGGERPVRRDPQAGAEAASGARSPASAEGYDPDEAGGLSEAEMEARMAELQEQLARTPAEVVITNHALGMFELARLHLSLVPPQLDQARLAIDALGALVDGLGPRLGEHAGELAEGVANLRIAYVQIHAATQGGGAAQEPGSGGD